MGIARLALTGASLFTLAMGAGAATAQQAASAKPDSVQDYLCTFAGKCGNAAAGAETPTIAAPATRGFRLAAPQAAGKTPAPAAVPASQAVRAPTGTNPAAGTRRVTVAVPSSRAVAAGAATATAGNGARADLRLSFDYNSDRLTPDAQSRARVFAQALMTPELKDKRFLIEGHTDRRGKRDLNMDLSRRRAETVASFLAGQGVDRSRVEVKGVGPDQPLPGTPATAEANRRVEAVLIS